MILGSWLLDDSLNAYIRDIRAKYAASFCREQERLFLEELGPSPQQEETVKSDPSPLDPALVAAREIWCELCHPATPRAAAEKIAEIIRKYFPSPAKEPFAPGSPYESLFFLPEHVVRLCTLLERVRKEAADLDGFSALPVDRLIDFLEAGLNRWNADLKESRAAVDKLWQDVRKVTDQRRKAAV